MDKLELKLEHYKERVALYEDTIADLRAQNTLLHRELAELRAQPEQPPST